MFKGFREAFAGSIPQGRRPVAINLRGCQKRQPFLLASVNTFCDECAAHE